MLVASLVMLGFGFAGETYVLPEGVTESSTPMIYGVVATLAWLYIIYEVFAGEAGKLNASSGNAAAQSAFGTIRLIVTFGWAIYPIGYWMALQGTGDGYANANLVYNLADFVNKISKVVN